jgi:hypothetical protein
MRKPTLLALLAFVAGGAHAQTITFTNANPAATVRLEAGSQVSIDASGNLIARCDATDPAGCARLLQTGGGSQCGTGVTFTSPLNVTSPTNPPAPGPYPGGSQLTVSAQMTGAAVCMPSAVLGANPVSISGWTAPLVPNGNIVTQTLTLPTQPSTTYTLRLTCYGSTGSATSERSVTTSAQVTPPPSQCPTQFPTTVAYTSTATGGGGSTTDIPGVSVRNINGFEQLLNVFGNPVNPFPISGTSGIVIGPWTQIRVIRFTVPDPFPTPSPANPFNLRFQLQNWPNGFLDSNLAYISISSCPGDLRVPTATQNGTTEDPTYAEGCRNWRGISWDAAVNTGLAEFPYVIASAGNDTSTPTQCRLVPGRTYYMNMYMSRPNRTTRTLLPANNFCVDPQNTPFDCGHVINIGN